ncbi:MICOS complex subunit MIC60 isoform 2-T2 [Synchiropus picturatus]
MFRVLLRGTNITAQKNWRRNPLINLQRLQYHTEGNSSATSKVVAAGLVTFAGGIGATLLYAKWDHKFRIALEKKVPYSDWILSMALGPSMTNGHLPARKENEQRPSMLEQNVEKPKVKMDKKAKESQVAQAEEISPPPTLPVQSLQEASVEATHIISAISEVPSVPAPCDTEAVDYESSQCPDKRDSPVGAEVTPEVEPLKVRPAEEVSALLAKQDQEEQEKLEALSASLDSFLASSAEATLQAIGAQKAALEATIRHTQSLKEAMESEVSPEEKSAQWKDLETYLADRTSAITEAEATVINANESLDSLKLMIEKSKMAKIAGASPILLAAEENLHQMILDLDKMVKKVQAAEAEAKVVSQYTELVNEAKRQFQREVTNLTPEIQANWKGLRRLSVDDLNALIAHAHRRIDQLNRELAEQRVREQIHIDVALEQQRLEHQKTLESTVNASTLHIKEEQRLEKERKLAELRDVMEAEMRTQLRRQAAAHTDHVREVLKVQEQELRDEAEQVLISKTQEQETRLRQLTQEQLDNFILDMNAAYARLKGIEEAIDSHVEAEEEARKAHQLWLSVEGLNYALSTADIDAPSRPLESAVEAVRGCCHDNDFAVALTSALPEESLKRGIYSEASLRSSFNSLHQLVRRVALIDESHNSLYQYFLSYLQAALLFQEKPEAPPAQLTIDDYDPFKLLSYASYCLEHGDLELAAKLVNQLTGEARRALDDWLKEARLTLETRQVISLLSAYANAAGLGTTQVPLAKSAL